MCSYCWCLSRYCASATLEKLSTTTAGTPTFVPWQDHPAEPKFICDVMTEGLAKQLRLYGVDAAAVETQGKHARHLVYRSALLDIPSYTDKKESKLGLQKQAGRYMIDVDVWHAWQMA